ncbi:MAG: YIP1 family protein [Trueperaceae bacterium]|nr:YIP1 family protein [Trueperaceae bacterium]
MLEGILEAIIQPIKFFRELEDKPQRVSLAFIVVLITAILAAVVAYFSALPTADAFPDSAFIGQISMITAPIVALIATFIIWLAYGLLIRMGAGMDVKPWAIAAYSSAPQIIILTIVIVIAALFPVTVSPITADPSNAEAFRAANLQLQEEIRSSVYGRSSQVLSYLSSLWQVILVYLGISAVSSQARAIRGTVLVAIFAFGFLLLPWLLASV